MTNYFVTIFQILAPRPLKTFLFFTSAPPIRPVQCGSQAKAFHDASHADVTNPIVLRQFIDWLGRTGKRRFFFFVHLWDVHYDYIPPPPFDRMFDPDYQGNFSARDFGRNKDFRPGMDRTDYEHVVALYDGEIRSTDETIDGILGALKRYGFLGNTLVVITADHGDEFLDHGDKGHRHTLFQELVSVPLLFWYPRRVSPRRVESVARLIDVAPTILELAGLPPLAGSPGLSLVPLIDGANPEQEQRPALAELSSAPRAPDLLALRLGDEKVIIKQDDGSSQYYQLAMDPGERKPRDGASTAAAKPLLDLARDLQSRYRRRAMAPLRLPLKHLEKRTRDQLRSLGYVK